MDTPIYLRTAMEHSLVSMFRTVDPATLPIPFEDVLYAAGAEARAIVRAGLRDVRVWLGEVK